MSWLGIVKMVLELLPAIIAALKAIESVLPETGKGAEKLALVRDIVEGVNDDAKNNWPLIENTIGKIVAFLNKVGVFKKNTPAPSAGCVLPDGTIDWKCNGDP